MVVICQFSTCTPQTNTATRFNFYSPISQDTQISNPYKVISEDELLEHLSKVEEDYSATDRFVGLSSFVKNHLGLLDYDYATSYSVINQLEQKGKVEIYPINRPYGFPVTAVKLKR